MFEYLNYGALGALGFMIFIIFVANLVSEKKMFIGSYILLFICIGLLFLEAYDKHTTALTNISDFKNKNVALKCISGGGLYTSADTYRVSLDDGWKVDKDYFIKESLAVRANKCERW